MYHRIDEETFDPWGLAVTPERFEEQLRWIAEHRTPLHLPDFVERQQAGSLPANAIALTFDDGYSCSADAAAPLLKRFKIPATIFLPVELIERGDPFWWDELERLVLDCNCESLRVGHEDVPLGEKRAEDRIWKPGASPQTPRQHAFHRLWSLLRPLRPEELNRSMANLRLKTSQHTSRLPMSTDQVRSTASEHIAFGSHALTHPWLTSLDRSEKLHEIRDSMDRCQAVVGSRPSAFAYPYGNFDTESETLVREAGFTCACATIPSSVTSKSRPFALPRIQVRDWNGDALGRALAIAPG